MTFASSTHLDAWHYKFVLKLINDWAGLFGSLACGPLCCNSSALKGQPSCR